MILRIDPIARSWDTLADALAGDDLLLIGFRLGELACHGMDDGDRAAALLHMLQQGRWDSVRRLVRETIDARKAAEREAIAAACAEIARSLEGMRPAEQAVESSDARQPARRRRPPPPLTPPAAGQPPGPARRPGRRARPPASRLPPR